MSNELLIGARCVGDEYPPVLIAEIGINHEGSLETAKEMVSAAVSAGAEIIKHQTHIIEDEMSVEAWERIPGNASVSIGEIMQRCALSADDEWELLNFTKQLGAEFISTPFSRAAVDRLAEFGVPAFKIGSGECNNYPLVRYIARLGKPIIVSTGMNSIETIRPTVEILREAGVPFALLHCTNLYPTPPNLVRLNAMVELKEFFPDAIVGLSDHSETNYPSLGAVALGANIVERHFTDSSNRPGPDIVCSNTPETFSELLLGMQIIFAARGGHKTALVEEQITMDFAFGSVATIQDIKQGDVFTSENIWVLRPAGGAFDANSYESILGRTCNHDIPKGTQLPQSAVGNL